MVTLTLAGKTLPASLLANFRYELVAAATGYDPVSVTWTVLLGSTVVSTGSGPVVLTPTGSQQYTVHVLLANSSGAYEEAVFSINSILTPEAPEISVNWTSLSYSAGDVIRAQIRVKNPNGITPVNVRWTLLRNNLQIASGTSSTIRYQTSSPGVYRLKSSVTDDVGNTVNADSAVYVAGGFEIQASLAPVAVDPTCIYLGALYVNEVVGSGGPVTSLPYQLACYSEDVHLLPGTTHISFDLDPQQNRIDDEVVVRTKTGNYLIRGYPTGLSSESVGYDYTSGLPMLPAPADGILKLTVEAFNVHGPVADAFNFRVRVKCWKHGDAIYRYARCPLTTFPGGTGERSRLFAALFTEIEAKTDALTDLNRLGYAGVSSYTTPEVTSIPLTTLTTDGLPNPVQAATGMFLTASNWIAVYENTDSELPELDVRAVAGQEGGRPFYFTLEVPGTPPIIQRISRLKGKLVVYMSRGSLIRGTRIRARVYTSRVSLPVDYVDCFVDIDVDVYNASQDTFQRVGSVDIDISDFQFSGNGVVVSFDVDESGAEASPLSCDPPDAILPPENIYTSTNAASVVFDGACYSQPVPQDTVDTSVAFEASAINGCYETVCGPVGTYCYTNMLDGSLVGSFRQPLYFPSPYVAYGSNPLNCYQNPILVSEATGSQDQVLILRDSTALCGDGWLYGQCSNADQIVTVYPHNTVPHEVISYGSRCWSVSGSLSLAGSTAAALIASGTEFVSAGSVIAVASCLDAVCTGSVSNGSSVVYRDTQTDQLFSVLVEGMSGDPPFFGAAPEVIDSGLGNLPKGELSVTFTKPRVFLFTCAQSGQVSFKVGLFDLEKRIVVVRAGSETKHEIGLGSDSRFVDLRNGDAVYIDIANKAGLLSDRTRNKRTRVTWSPVIVLPRKYHESTVTFSGSSSVLSLGFAGITNRSEYTMFQTVPVDVEQELPNPDNIVTVRGQTGPEYILVRSRAVGDVTPQLPGGLDWYAGQALTGPITFSFYTSREDQGAHGEMDVWLDGRSGTFPAYFSAGPYRALELVSPVTRTNNCDVSRNSLRVSTSDYNIHWPVIYVNSAGERIYVVSDVDVISYNDSAYTALGYDTGISSNVLSYTAVAADTNWITTEGQNWTTDDGSPWTVGTTVVTSE